MATSLNFSDGDHTKLLPCIIIFMYYPASTNGSLKKSSSS